MSFLISPSISFFFARLGVFLESSSGQRPPLGLSASWVCALKPVLLELYPLIHQSFIWHHLNNEMVKERVDVRSSELDRGLSSNDNPIGVEVDTTTSKPSSSSQPKPFHVLKEKNIRRFRKRFQFSSKQTYAFLAQMKKLMPLPTASCVSMRPLSCVASIFPSILLS